MGWDTKYLSGATSNTGSIINILYLLKSSKKRKENCEPKYTLWREKSLHKFDLGVSNVTWSIKICLLNLTYK